jgi:hypothetical protein
MITRTLPAQGHHPPMPEYSYLEKSRTVCHERREEPAV